jgi:hypothetical protein
MELFSNREIATGIWLLIITTLIIFKVDKNITINCIKAILNPKLLCLALIILIFIILSTIILVKVNIWNTELLKDTIMYYLFLAIPFTYSKVINNKEPITKRFIKISLSFSAIFSLFFNIESFSLIIEITLLPIISLFTLIQATTKEEKVKALSLRILGVFAITILSINAINIFNTPDKYLNIETLISFTLPIFYSLIIIPCLHIFYMYASYESIFVSINFLLHKNIRLIAKLHIIKHCLLSRSKLNDINNKLLKELCITMNKEDFIKTLKEIKHG